MTLNPPIAAMEVTQAEGGVREDGWQSQGQMEKCTVRVAGSLPGRKQAHRCDHRRSTSWHEVGKSVREHEC